MYQRQSATYHKPIPWMSSHIKILMIQMESFSITLGDLKHMASCLRRFY